MNYSNIKIVKFDDEQEKYYLLAKIDDKKIICGDKNTINDSSKLITIDVEDILNKTYYMVSEKNGITLTYQNNRPGWIRVCLQTRIHLRGKRKGEVTQ